MYGNTSVRWIVHTLTPYRTYKLASIFEWCLRLVQCIVAINPAAIVATVIVATVNVTLDVARQQYCVMQQSMLSLRDGQHYSAHLKQAQCFRLK